MDFADEEIADMSNENDAGDEGTSEAASEDSGLAEKALVQKIIKDIRADKKHHQEAFKRMRRDMFVAVNGYDPATWSKDKYKANITGRHIRTKTAALYAKNPKATAKRHESLDFQVWDENEQSLMLAFQTVQQAQAMLASAPLVIDPLTGQAAPDPAYAPPGFQEAQAVIADFQQGMERRKQLKKFGRTLEIVFSRALDEQKPLDFKTAMKKVVRRACTTGVGYVEVGFQRETGPRPVTTEKLSDMRARLEHLNKLMDEAQEGEITEIDAEMQELRSMIESLQNEEEIILREGLIFDFPASTRVIPDKLTKSIMGFVGARHITIEYMYTKSQVEELFGVDIGTEFTAHKVEKTEFSSSNEGLRDDDQMELFPTEQKGDGTDLCCVWKMYDSESGLVYFVMDGYSKFLRPPAAPEVTVSDFWPVYALTFNDVESEDELFPPSDVTTMLDMQNEHNRSRQGKREHRQAARPRWAYARNLLDTTDIENLKSVKPFDAIPMSIDPSMPIEKVLQTIPVPGVDPNLYDTNETFADMQVSVGAQQAVLGGLAKATATESAIAAGSASSTDGSSVDDLDSFLSAIARASSQILMREMSEESVIRIVGKGAVWPVQTDKQIIEEMYLDVEAGSTGKPNQAVEINNWKEMLPFLLQMGSIPPTWLARESLRRLDDRMDLSEAIVDGIPAIVAQNRMAQPMQGASDPAQQGDKGSDNTAKPADKGSGSGPAFGSNQV